MTYGDTQINCEIGKCKEINGAIKNIKGTLKSIWRYKNT